MCYLVSCWHYVCTTSLMRRTSIGTHTSTQTHVLFTQCESWAEQRNELRVCFFHLFLFSISICLPFDFKSKSACSPVNYYFRITNNHGIHRFVSGACNKWRERKSTWHFPLLSARHRHTSHSVKSHILHFVESHCIHSRRTLVQAHVTHTETQ